MADLLNLNSKNYRRAVALPEPQAIVPPKRGDYLGAEKDSDAAMLAAGMSDPKRRVPGDGMPGEAWQSNSSSGTKRGSLRR